MAGATFEVVGADRLARTMAGAGRDLTHLQPAMSRIGGVVVSAAAAPHRSGRLAASVGVVGADDQAALIGSNVAYAGVIEYGWARRGITPSGFLGDAGRRTEGTWTGIIAGEVDRALSTVKGA